MSPAANRTPRLCDGFRATQERLTRSQVDLVTMTGNVAQVFITDESWASTLTSARAGFNPGGAIVFEVREPAKRAWETWTATVPSGRHPRSAYKASSSSDTVPR